MGIMYKLMKHRNLTMDLHKTPHKKRLRSECNRLITIEGNIIERPPSARAVSPAHNLTKNVAPTADKQFTADHIIQLCKFLAEKSKRNKNVYKQQQSPKKVTKNRQSQFPFQRMDCNDNPDEMAFYQDEALPLLSKYRLEHQQKNQAENENNNCDDFGQHKETAVLSTRLSPDINSLNISLNTSAATACVEQQYHQQHQQQQEQVLQQQHQEATHTYSHQHQQQVQPQPLQNQGKRDILLKIRRQIFERKRLRENVAYEPPALDNSQVWRPW